MRHIILLFCTIIVFVSYSNAACFESKNDKGTIVLKQYYIINDSLRTLCTDFFNRQEGNLEQDYYLFIKKCKEGLAFFFIHAKDSERIINYVEGKQDTYIGKNNILYGAITYNNLTIYIFIEKEISFYSFDDFFLIANKELVLHRTEENNDDIYFIYLPTKAYLYKENSFREMPPGKLMDMCKH